MKAEHKQKIASLLKQASDLLQAYPEPAPVETIKVAAESTEPTPEFSLNFEELRRYLNAAK